MQSQAKCVKGKKYKVMRWKLGSSWCQWGRVGIQNVGYQRHFPEHLCKLLFSCTSCTLLELIRRSGSVGKNVADWEGIRIHLWMLSQRPTTWDPQPTVSETHSLENGFTRLVTPGTTSRKCSEKSVWKKRKRYQLINIVTSNSQVSLSRMILDIFKFCCLYLLVLFAFSCGKIIFFPLTSNLFSIFILATHDSHFSLVLQNIANATT